MSISTARTCAFSSRPAISRHSAARSVHSLEVIIGYSPNRTHQSTTRTVGLLDFMQPPSPSGRFRGWARQAGLAEVGEGYAFALSKLRGRDDAYGARVAGRGRGSARRLEPRALE